MSRTSIRHTKQSSHTNTPHQQPHASSSILPCISRTSSSSSLRRQRRDREHTPPQHMADPGTSTPVKTPRRRGGGGGGAGGGGAPRSAQRRGAEGGSNEESGAGEEELFGLLGVTSPTAKPVEPVEVVEKQRGLLSITRADIEASSSTSASTARNDKSTPRSKAGRGKTKGPKDPKEPKETAVQEVPVSDTTFNTSTLSQSLPSTFFAPAPIVGAAGTEGEEGKKKKRAKGKKQAGTDEQDKSIPKKDVKSKGRDLDKGASGPGDTGQVWDIPADAGPSAAQNMTVSSWSRLLDHIQADICSGNNSSVIILTPTLLPGHPVQRKAARTLHSCGISLQPEEGHRGAGRAVQSRVGGAIQTYLCPIRVRLETKAAMPSHLHLLPPFQGSPVWTACPRRQKSIDRDINVVRPQTRYLPAHPLIHMHMHMRDSHPWPLVQAPTATPMPTSTPNLFQTRLKPTFHPSWTPSHLSTPPSTPSEPLRRLQRAGKQACTRSRRCLYCLASSQG